MLLEKRELHKEIDQALCRDRHHLRQSLRRLPQELSESEQAVFQKFRNQLEKSKQSVAQRKQNIPSLKYPEKLPIVSKKEDIIEAIQKHQVVVITGETGSGKTTQIPKMCLEAGRGIFGKIGCTQPRRIAATSLAQQVAKEMNTEVGDKVGFKIRFADKTQDSTLIQFMTDGILLAELQGSRFLNNYDTIIIDEAHERTLNIDFLLGCLKILLPKRPELKLIITSATIDVEKFSRAFPQYYCERRKEYFLYDEQDSQQSIEANGAPIVEVSGRMYPVELRYHPIDELLEERGDLTMVDLVKDAVEEVLTETSDGDILVFMAGLMEIRETVDRLQYLTHEGFIVLPLFGRLSAADQNRIFRSSSERKIILATNIAETSITIPGVRYVIDSGRARISQYNTRSGTQGLPVVPISQSSANQRMGRCGRVSNGICIRLYTEEDFIQRLEYTPPEIQRSNLSDVILQMSAQRLGDVSFFPFVDPPESAQIRAGYRTLKELGALTVQNTLTPLGREMAHLPVDPRTARMILQAKKECVLYAVLIIASAISCQDPRERPDDNPMKADQIHAPFVSKESDLMTILNLWEHYHSSLEELKTQGKMRKFCKKNFLSYRRMREWKDIHDQLVRIAKEKDWHIRRPDNRDYDAIHRSIIAGYLTHIAQKKEKKLYQGTKNRELTLFPGSGQYKSKHDWIVTIEIIETSRLFAHRVAKIQPDWLESVAGDLCKKHWTQPRWEPKTNRVVAWEKVTLFGLILVEQRKVNYGNINILESTEIFIRDALIAGNFICSLPFWKHNQELIKQIQERENKTRKRNLLVTDEVIEEFYQKRISEVSCIQDLQKLINIHGGDKFLFMTEEDLLRQEPEANEDQFPEFFQMGDKKCPLVYIFEPGHKEDGVTVQLPWSLVNTLQPEPFEYLVPGLLQEKILWFLKALPKQTRKKLVPIPEKATLIWEEMTSLRFSTGQERGAQKATKEFYQELTDNLFQQTRVFIEAETWDRKNLPDYLRMNFSVRNPRTKKIQNSRQLGKLQNQDQKKRDDWKRLILSHERYHISSWDFETLLEEVLLSKEGDVPQWGYRTLAKGPDGLKLTLSKTKDTAQDQSYEAIAALLELHLGEDLSWLYQEIRFPAETLRHFQTLWNGQGQMTIEILRKKFGGSKNQAGNRFHEQFQKLCFQILSRGLCGYSGNPLWTEKAFQRRLDKIRAELKGLGGRAVEWIGQTIELRQQLLLELHELKFYVGAPLLESIQKEIENFLSPDWLEELPLEEWRHCTRILRAYSRRLEKLKEETSLEEEKQEECFAYNQQADLYWDQRKQFTVQQLWTVQQYRWMVEEYKVSLFAQNLKTAFPISPKRLDKFWREKVTPLFE